MKPHYIICTLLLGHTASAYSEEVFTPKLPIDHKLYIDEALRHLLKERPKLSAANLAFSHISYQYQTMGPTTSVCGPNGCQIVPAAPFQETLSISFTVLDSKRSVAKGNDTLIEHDSLVVQFPTPRMPQWHILTGTSSYAAPAPQKEKAEQGAQSNR